MLGFRGILTAALLIACLSASANPISTDNVTASLVAERTGVTPGEVVKLALVLDIRPGWHTYWENPGDSGEPTRIEWRLPDGVTVSPIRWPHPELIRVGPLANYGYSGRAVHLVSVEVPDDWPEGVPLEVTAEAHWLVCEEHCIPESAELSLNLPLYSQPIRPDSAVGEIFAAARQRLPQPFPDGAELRVSRDGALQLAVETGALTESPDKVWFFPREWGLVEHAADQTWRLEDGLLQLDLAPGARAGRVPPEGVLVIETGGHTLAYAVAPERVAAGRKIDGQPAVAELGLPLALGLALLGGLILNLMPCVFPVLAMKALSLTRQGGMSSRVRALHGLAYTAGVLAFFALVAALLLALRAGGTAVGWGYQLQHPPFVALMAYLFLVLGLSLAGAVTLGSRLMGIGAVGSGGGSGGAFVTGGLAALVAAPCTAPFMGAALGYSVTLSWPLALAVMLTLGFGLALPYLLLALVPGAHRILPKPGAWMESLKQFLAFPMFATAAWLVWVLSVQTGPPGVATILAGMVLLALGLWLWERARPMAGRIHLLAGGVAVSAAAAALILGLGIARIETVAEASQDMTRGASDVLKVQAFSSQRLEMARGEGRPVFVNMTAAWCITCLVNERVAISSEAVADAFDDAGVLYLKGDWTNRDPIITAYLERFGRNGVPLYVLYPPRAEAKVLPQILTESILLDALESVRSPSPESGI